MIKSRNADVEPVAVSAVEGKPMYGGNMLVKPLIKGDEMTFLEIHYVSACFRQMPNRRKPKTHFCKSYTPTVT